MYSTRTIIVINISAEPFKIQSDTKKRKLLKTPIKIEEIQEKKFIDRNWTITTCLLRNCNPNYQCLKITSCRWRPPPRMHSFTSTTHFKSSRSFVSPCVCCMLCRMRLRRIYNRIYTNALNVWPKTKLRWKSWWKSNNIIYSIEFSLTNHKYFLLYSVFSAFTCRFFSITVNFELNGVYNSLLPVAVEMYTEYWKYRLRGSFIFKSIWKQYSQQQISTEE